MTRSLRSSAMLAARLVVALLLSTVVPSDPAWAADMGVGRRFVGIAEIDPLSAVIGSNEVRSYPSMEAERGVIEIRDVNANTVLGSAKTGRNGEYVVALTAPLVAGQIIQAVNTTKGYFSSGVKVPTDPPGPGETAPAPSIDEPLLFGATTVTGRGAPGHQVALLNAVDGSVIAQTTQPLPRPGTGDFSLTVPPLPPFRILQALDLNTGAAGKLVPVLGRAARGKLPRNPCKMKPGKQEVGNLSVTLYACDLQHPRGLAVGPDQKLYITAGAPPSDIINAAPSGVFRLDPDSGALDLFSAVHGVGLRFAPPSYVALNQDLFLARPRLFLIRGRMAVHRNDGEVFQIDKSTGEATVRYRVLDSSPTGVGFDTTPTLAFGGQVFVTSFLGAGVEVFEPMYGAAGTELPGLRGLWGMVFGDGGAFGNDAFASQPAAGKILRITNPGGLMVQDFATGLVSPTDLAFGPGGPFGNNLFVADPGAQQIVMLDPTGMKTTFGTGFIRPFGIAFDPVSQSMYVSDYETGDILRVR